LGMRSISAQLRERVRQEKPPFASCTSVPVLPDRQRSGRPPTSPTRCRSGLRTAPATASTLHRRICRADARTLWSWSCPSCSGAGCFVPNMRARHCAKISGSNARSAATPPRARTETWTGPRRSVLDLSWL
jgi:hypothetical protein